MRVSAKILRSHPHHLSLLLFAILSVYSLTVTLVRRVVVGVEHLQTLDSGLTHITHSTASHPASVPRNTVKHRNYSVPAKKHKKLATFLYNLQEAHLYKFQYIYNRADEDEPKHSPLPHCLLSIVALAQEFYEKNSFSSWILSWN
ncbi:MAG: hypothetical protein HC862_26755 [Scytonema sp. RU_4_4]|nr:hypothetical protein [Scytonema sp. RU_4_4]